MLLFIEMGNFIPVTIHLNIYGGGIFVKLQTKIHNSKIYGYTFQDITFKYVCIYFENGRRDEFSFNMGRYPKLEYEGPKELRNFLRLLRQTTEELK